MSDKVRVAIVEDEYIIAESIRVNLENLGYEVSHVSRNYTQVCMNLDIPTDIYILDINLRDEKTGHDVAEKLKEEGIPFIFLTSYADKETLEKSGKLSPHGYLTKPYNNITLHTTITIALNNARQMSENKAGKVVYIKQGDSYQRVHTSDILFVRSDRNYLELQTEGRKLLIRASLDSVNYPDFIRVHRSYAVNLQHVESVSPGSLRIGEWDIPVGRAYRKSVQSHFDLEH